MKTYIGTRFKDNSTQIMVHLSDGKSYPLDPRLDIAEPSPSGQDWRSGSGSAQIAIGLLVSARPTSTTGSDFPFDFPFDDSYIVGEELVKQFPRNGFVISDDDINDAIAKSKDGNG